MIIGFKYITGGNMKQANVLQKSIKSLPTNVVRQIYMDAKAELQRRSPSADSVAQDRINKEIDDQLQRRLSEL